MKLLRITTSDGVVLREPDCAAIADVLAATEHSGTGGFVVLDGDTAGDAPFLQALYLGRGQWEVEAWRVAGAEGRGLRDRCWYAARSSAEVARTFWSWASGTDRWQQEAWQQPVPRSECRPLTRRRSAPVTA